MSPIPRSSVESIHWPAIPNPAASLDLSIQHQLSQTEWLSPDEMRELQHEQLAALLKHAYDHVPFYRERFRAAGFRPRRLTVPDKWQRIALLTRREIATAGDALYSDRVPADHGALAPMPLSGAGEPATIQVTAVSQLLWHAMTVRSYRWHEWDLSLKLATIGDRADGESTGPGQEQSGWGKSTGRIYDAGTSVSLPADTSLQQQVDSLREHSPDYLRADSSAVLALAEYCLAHAVELQSLRQVQCTGDMPGARHREAALKAWGAKLVFMYGPRETGYLAIECPTRPGAYHVQSEGVVLEVLDDDGTACRPGQCGRVVVTALQNFAAPLIRYAIGDRATVGSRCECGRGLAVLTDIYKASQST